MPSASEIRAAAAQLKAACAEIDRRLAEAQRAALVAAFEAIERGDMAERDRILARYKAMPDEAAQAKAEVWRRIGRLVGLSEAQLGEAMRLEPPGAGHG